VGSLYATPRKSQKCRWEPANLWGGNGGRPRNLRRNGGRKRDKRLRWGGSRRKVPGNASRGKRRLSGIFVRTRRGSMENRTHSGVNGRGNSEHKEELEDKGKKRGKET